jgi:hypothetical protein
VTRIARVADPDRAGRFILGYTLTPMVNGFAQPPLFSNRPLIRNVRDATFTLEFDVGPRLLRATIDLTVFPDDVENNQAAIATGMDGKVLRLLASTSPRRLDQ